MRPWQKVVASAAVAAVVWFIEQKVQKVLVRKGRLATLQKGGYATKEQLVPVDRAPYGVPDEAYAEACNVVCAGSVPGSEFHTAEAGAIWTHRLPDHHFEAVWTDGQWSLRRLLKRDGTETPLPVDMDRVIRDYRSLLADLRQRGLESRPLGWR